MRSRLRLRVLLPTAVVALAGAGVGAFAFGGAPPLAGDDPLPATTSDAAPNNGQTDNTPAGVSLTAWAKQANALCRAALEEADSLEEPTTPEELQANVAATVARATKLVAGLDALPRPAGQKRDIGSLLRIAGKTVKTLEQAQQALAARDTAAFARAMDEGHALDAKSDAVAVRLGASGCVADSTKRPTPLEDALLRDRVVVVALYSSDSTLDRLSIEEARAGAAAAKAGFLAVEVDDSKDVSSLARAYSVTKAPAVLVMRRWVGAVTTFQRYVDRETVAQAAANAKA